MARGGGVASTKGLILCLNILCRDLGLLLAVPSRGR